MLKALADRLVEGFAEHMHSEYGKNFGVMPKMKHLNNDDLIDEEYTGIRPAPGTRRALITLKNHIIFSC